MNFSYGLKVLRLRQILGLLIPFYCRRKDRFDRFMISKERSSCSRNELFL